MSAIFRWESYKVLGSMNILGDPIGWTLSVGGAAISEKSVKEEAWHLFQRDVSSLFLCFFRMFRDLGRIEILKFNQIHSDHSDTNCLWVVTDQLVFQWETAAFRLWAFKFGSIPPDNFLLVFSPDFKVWKLRTLAIFAPRLFGNHWVWRVPSFMDFMTNPRERLCFFLEAVYTTPTVPMPILCFHPFISTFLNIPAMSNLEIILDWKDKGNAKLKEEETKKHQFHRMSCSMISSDVICICSNQTCCKQHQSFVSQ